MVGAGGAEAREIPHARESKSSRSTPLRRRRVWPLRPRTGSRAGAPRSPRRASCRRSYVNPRDFSGDPADGTADDLGPEGLTFVPAAASPSGKPLVIVANEVSGTVSIYELVAQ